MKDTKEIVLFFEEGVNFSLLDVSREIVSRYKECGEPILFPDDGKTKAPLILFNTNPDFQIQISRVSLNFVVNHHYFKKLAALIFDMVDVFEEFKCKFYRMGYISSIFLSPDYVKRVKNRFLRVEELVDISEFNLCWYKRFQNKFGYINCWEKFITDSTNFKDLLIQYDINTPVDENISFDMKYIKEFIVTANDYIEKRIDFK